MQEKKIIILPVDFSEHALRALGTAKAIARAYGGEILALHVIEPPSAVMKALSEYREEAAIKKARHMLDAFIKEHQEDDVSITRMVKVGKPPKKIIQAADELDALVIVMGTHGASGIEEVFVGSTAARVIKSCHCPVITVRKKPKNTGFKKILLPLDLSTETKEKIRNGINIAKRFDAKLHIVSILKSKDKAIYERLTKQLDKSVAYIKAEGVEVQAQLIEGTGNISDVVMKHAEEIEADILCIMTQQELKFREFFLGSNAAHIVNHSQVPVLSVRPRQLFPAKRLGSVFG